MAVRRHENTKNTPVSFMNKQPPAQWNAVSSQQGDWALYPKIVFNSGHYIQF